MVLTNFFDELEPRSYYQRKSERMLALVDQIVCEKFQRSLRSNSGGLESCNH